jgi:hypothetical protein
MKKVGLIVFLSILSLMFFCADYEDLEIEPVPVVLSIKTVTDSSVTVSWSQCEDKYIYRYKVYYSKGDIVDQNDSLSDSLSFKSDTVKIVKPLKPNTRYYFRVFVITETGNSVGSNTVYTLTTNNTVAADTIKVLKLFHPENITDSSVTLRWSKSQVAFDSYKIYADTVWKVDSLDKVYKTVYQDTSAVIINLVKNKTYWFRVYAQKDTGFVAKSNSVEVKIGVE